jgi:hypothetical protein
MNNIQDAGVVLAALAEAGGRYVDDHIDREATVKHAAIFQRANSRDVCVPILSGQYFCLNGMYIGEDSKVHLSKESVGGVVDGRTLGVKESIEYFNKVYQPSRLIDLTEFEVRPAAATRPVFKKHEDFYTYADVNESHDAAGTIFYRNTYFNTITGKDSVDWQIARAVQLTPSDVYVREYTVAGAISHYIHMPVMEKLIKHHDFCKANGIPCGEIRDVDSVREAISLFYQYRGIIC